MPYLPLSPLVLLLLLPPLCYTTFIATVELPLLLPTFPTAAITAPILLLLLVMVVLLLLPLLLILVLLLFLQVPPCISNPNLFILILHINWCQKTNHLTTVSASLDWIVQECKNTPLLYK